jgi:starch synthase
MVARSSCHTIWLQGKAAARAELRRRVNLTSWQDKLIVAVVSRLTPQKGVHLIKHTAFRTVERGGQFVLLGSAPDPKLQVKRSGVDVSQTRKRCTVHGMQMG